MFRLFSFTIIGIVLIYAIESAGDEKYITGKVTHDGQNNIDANSKILVELRDISLMDVASKLISSTTISNAKTFPFSYTLKYNSSEIMSHNTYAVSVRITGPDGKLQFINDIQRQALLNDSIAPTIDINVIRVGESSSSNRSKLGDKKACGPVKCPNNKRKKCPYGYEKKDGCEICKCNDPCNPSGKPILCGPKQRCVIDKKPDGTFGTHCDIVTSYKDKRSKDEDIDSKSICEQPKKAGLCRANFQRYYYNSATKNCESFSYGGCHGNKNNFRTKAACEETCKP